MGAMRMPPLIRRLARMAVPPAVGWALVAMGMVLTVYLAGRMQAGASFLNTSRTIFDAAHLWVEAVILSAILFLAADVLWRGRRDPAPSRGEALARRARLTIALAIFTVHGTVLLLGGYRP